VQREKWNTKKLKNPVCNKYENRLNNTLKGHEEISNIQVQWLSTGIIRVMTKVTEKVTGERETRYNDDDLIIDVWIIKTRRDTKC
jgi:hypothetical protein